MLVSYNNSFRRLFGLPYYCSASEMFVSCDILTQPEITRKMTWGFIEKLRRCSNNVIMCLSEILWTLLWCSAQDCGSIFTKLCLEATDCILAKLSVIDFFFFFFFFIIIVMLYLL